MTFVMTVTCIYLFYSQCLVGGTKKQKTMKRSRSKSPQTRASGAAASSQRVLVHIKQQHKDPSVHDESDKEQVLWSQYNIIKSIRESLQRYGKDTPVMSEGFNKTATQSDVTALLRRIGTEEFRGPLPPFESLTFMQRNALYEFGAAQCLFYAGEFEALHASISKEEDDEIRALTHGGLRVHTAKTPSEKSYVLYQLTTRREIAAINKVSALFADGNRVVLLVYGAFHEFASLARKESIKLVEVGIPPFPARATPLQTARRCSPERATPLQTARRCSPERATPLQTARGAPAKPRAAPSSPPKMTDEEFDKRKRFGKKYRFRSDLQALNPELKEELERNRVLYNAEYGRRSAAGMTPWEPVPTDRPTSPDVELPSEDDTDEDSDEDGHLGIARLHRPQTKADLAVLGVSLAKLQELESQDARRNAVRRAYMALALTHHPDKGGSEHVFKRIDAAKVRLIGGKRAKKSKTRFSRSKNHRTNNLELKNEF
jgi:hypothetical protein